MNPTRDDSGRQGRRLRNAIKEDVRELSIQLSLLNHRVSARLALKDADLECLDLIGRNGPVSPSVLARLAGMHPATMTGVLDRLEKGGWITRERHPEDRRAVAVQAKRERNSEIFAMFAGMNGALDELLATYDEEQLDVISDFLKRAKEAGREATDAFS